eukprot:CAMPEP_0178905984 /NCGR_PEP_ID=MMETSP0786-20121207/6579_1 /TAXON_ID=186022 /ORGANISM="Thalassionema frauenfeldii, Strain CCMP 1798" /LENGTH=577 /DNA_ID=CAMNT_0020577653 /DNA_START=389 /DNA_END=2122 /DNA_ORIENTATION=+
MTTRLEFGKSNYSNEMEQNGEEDNNETRKPCNRSSAGKKNDFGLSNTPNHLEVQASGCGVGLDYTSSLCTDSSHGDESPATSSTRTLSSTGLNAKSNSVKIQSKSKARDCDLNMFIAVGESANNLILPSHYDSGSESSTKATSMRHLFQFSSRRRSRYSFAQDESSTAQTSGQSRSVISIEPVKLFNTNIPEDSPGQAKPFGSGHESLKREYPDWEELDFCLRQVEKQRYCDTKCNETCLIDNNGKRDITAYSIYDELKRLSGVARLQTLMQIFRAHDSHWRMMQFFGCLRCFCSLVGDPKFGLMVIFKGEMYLPPVKVKLSIPQPCRLLSETHVQDEIHLEVPNELPDLKTEVTKSPGFGPKSNRTSPSTRSISPANRFGGSRDNASRRRATLLAMALSRKDSSPSASSRKDSSPSGSQSSSAVAGKKQCEASISLREPLRPLVPGTYASFKRNRKSPEYSANKSAKTFSFDDDIETWRERAKRESLKIENRPPTQRFLTLLKSKENIPWHYVTKKCKAKPSNQVRVTHERATMLTKLSQSRAGLHEVSTEKSGKAVILGKTFSSWKSGGPWMKRS